MDDLRKLVREHGNLCFAAGTVVCMIILGVTVLVVGGTRRLATIIILGFLLDVGIVLVIVGAAEALGSSRLRKGRKKSPLTRASGKSSASRGGRKR